MAGKLRNDLTGQIYGYLNVLSRSDRTGNGKKPTVMWNCRCKCGKTIVVSSSGLKNKHNVSCGCQKVKHMESYKPRSRLYNIWKCMRQRCNNPRNPNYPRYGGKGVRIREEWTEYSVFRDWAYVNGYRDDLSIDRINSSGNYCPENCRWTNAKVQSNNTNRNHYIEFHGERLTIAQIADRLNVSYSTIQHRVERGQPLEV